MRDSPTTTPLISSDFDIDQYLSGSLNVQYARADTINGGIANVEQLPFVLGIKGPGTIRRDPYPSPDGTAVFERSDEPYTTTLGKIKTTQET